MATARAKKTEATECEFKVTVGSNVIVVDGKKMYLKELIWNENVKYEDLKDKIVG